MPNCKRFVFTIGAVLVFSLIAVHAPTATESDSVSPRFRKLMTTLESEASRFPGETGIVIKDLKTGQSISINGTRLFPSASLVKVPIMAAVFAAEQEGKLTLDDKLKLKRAHKSPGAGQLYRARLGKKYSIGNLMERMVEQSDNTACNMLVDTLGFGYINQKFVEFGLKNTDLRRGVMELKWRDAGIENYTTAEEMAYILEKIYRKELVSPRASGAMLATMKRQRVNDRIPRSLPDSLTIAHKTGTLRDTASDCGIIFCPEGDFIVCVLTSDIKNYRSAKRFISSVAEQAYACYKFDISNDDLNNKADNW
jgi:beta-lactamase class A